MKHSCPIIDPGTRLSSSHMTSAEKKSTKLSPNNFLLCCKAFNIEGNIFLWTTNDFVFTQVAAVAKFWSFPRRQRLLIERITFRIVGRYYNDTPGIADFYASGFYHEDCRNLNLPIIQRCPSLRAGRNGLQSYCWRQIADFLDHLCRFKYTASRSKGEGSMQTTSLLFPSLKSMKLDLVLFPCFFLRVTTL